MQGLVLTFRDYAIHMFPGVVILLAIYNVSGTDNLANQSTAVTLSIFFLGSYILGFLLDAINPLKLFQIAFTSERIPQNFKRSKFYKYLLIRVKPNLNCETVRREYIYKKFKTELEIEFGHDAVECQGFAQQIYLANAVVSASSPILHNKIDRINALENMAKNLVMPMLILSLSYFLEIFLGNSALRSLVLLIFCLYLSIMLLERRIRYRNWLARTIIRSYIALRCEHELKRKDAAS